MQRLLFVSAVIAAAAVTPGQLRAGPMLYTVVWNGSGATTGTLESFTPSTFTTPTVIGNLGVDADYGGLAYDTANNTMYLVDGYGNDTTTTSSSLYSVNLTTGVATLIGSTGLADVTGLTYDSADNTLYAAQDGASPLEILNLSTGAATAVGSGIASADVNNLAYDSTNGVLYGWEDCLGCAALYSIDAGTGVGTLLSNSGLDSNDSGIVYDPVTNLLWDLDVRGYLTTIDPSSYVQTRIDDPSLFGGGESSGLALVPAAGSAVPEPSTMPSTAALIGSGMALLFVRSRRRAR
jgi:hypothetical protein